MKRNNISMVRLDIGNEKMKTAERLEKLERIIPIIVDAIRRDFSMIDMDNISEYGKNQLNERINKLIDEKMAEAEADV